MEKIYKVKMYKCRYHDRRFVEPIDRLYTSLELMDFVKNTLHEKADTIDDELQYSQTHRYELIEDGFVADRTNLENGLKLLAPLTRTDGILRTLDNAYYDTNYDGYGYLCKEIDGVMYQSSIVPNMDKPYPKIYLDNFTHIYWYERN